MSRPDPKRQGELAECAFLLKASSLGLTVSKPWGDSARYDFLVDNGKRVFRVQVKSGAYLNRTQFAICCTTSSGHCHRRRYQTGEVDLFAVYVIPYQAWYLIPAKNQAGATVIYLAPHRPSRGRFEPFREAWHLLTGPCETRP